MKTILYFTFLIFSCLVPILLWWYLFLYFDNSQINKKRFFLWILSWWLSVWPILYFSKIIEKLNLNNFNIFHIITKLDSLKEVFQLNISLILILILTLTIPFLLWIFKLWEKFKYKIKILILIKTFLIFTLYLLFFWIFFYLIQLSSNFLWLEKYVDWVKFWDIIFNSLKLVTFYYLLIWITEELSKFFFFNLWKYFQIQSVKQWVLYTIFIALGFAFIENILYINSIYSQSWNITSTVIWVFISRNIFSIICHVTSSAILWDFFSRAYLLFKYKLNFSFIKLVFLGFILSVFTHSLFDIFLTLNVFSIIILYIIWSYFYISYIFYKK